VDKPAGLVVHPGAGNPRHTLVNALLHRVPELVGLQPIRPGIVHRLDKETSGVMVVAKNQQAYLQLGRQFRTHSIKRVYLAFVKGSLSLDEDEVQLSIGRHPRDRKRFAVSYLQGGRAAITRYRVLKRFPRYTYVELAPKTGRTHQLRVHMAFLGHPILGDSKYGSGKDFTRLALHAHILGLLHPQSSRYLEFKSLLPLELKKLLE
jgi:23S rRNA pseudouridine1911/1915/1917 synthase